MYICIPGLQRHEAGGLLPARAAEALPPRAAAHALQDGREAGPRLPGGVPGRLAPGLPGSVEGRGRPPPRAAQRDIIITVIISMTVIIK